MKIIVAIKEVRYGCEKGGIVVGGAWSFIAIASGSLNSPKLGVNMLSSACLQVLGFSKDIWINRGPRGGSNLEFFLFFSSKNLKPTIWKETCLTPI
jgi:hypothetical protein